MFRSYQHTLAKNMFFTVINYHEVLMKYLFYTGCSWLHVYLRYQINRWSECKYLFQIIVKSPYKHAGHSIETFIIPNECMDIGSIINKKLHNVLICSQI